MNKTEAAEYLGVSPRAVERYVSAGKLPASYERGKTGKVLAIDETDLAAFKAELESPETRPTTPDKTRQIPAKRQEPTGATTTALARLDDGAESYSATALQLWQALSQLAPDNARQVATVPVESKLLLTLDEARALTGLSRDALRAAIEAKKLKGKIIGRGFKVKRADLDTYIDKL